MNISASAKTSQATLGKKSRWKNGEKSTQQLFHFCFISAYLPRTIEKDKWVHGFHSEEVIAFTAYSQPSSHSLQFVIVQSRNNCVESRGRDDMSEFPRLSTGGLSGWESNTESLSAPMFSMKTCLPPSSKLFLFQMEDRKELLNWAEALLSPSGLQNCYKTEPSHPIYARKSVSNSVNL